MRHHHALQVESVQRFHTYFTSLNARQSSWTDQASSSVDIVNKNVVAHKSLLQFTESECLHQGKEKLLKCTGSYVMDMAT